jgi:hypothetical protein
MQFWISKLPVALPTFTGYEASIKMLFLIVTDS